MVAQLLNGLHLLIHVMGLQEVTQLKWVNTGETSDYRHYCKCINTPEPGGNGIKADNSMNCLQMSNLGISCIFCICNQCEMAS